MKFSSSFVALVPFICSLFVGAAHGLPGYHPAVSSPPTSKPIYSYFVEIDVIVARLSSWSPHDQSSDYAGAEKDLFELGKSIDQATQALKVYQGTIDTHEAHKIDSSLKSCAKNVVGLTTNVKAAQAVFAQFSYTTLIVQTLQASANQFSVLFPLLESHSSSSSFASFGYSIGSIICPIGESIEYLQPNSCNPEGLQFCKSLKDSKAGHIDTKPACQVVKHAEPFSQCNQSATTLFKYGYDNKCIGKPQTQPWCNGNDSGHDSNKGGNKQKDHHQDKKKVPQPNNGPHIEDHGHGKNDDKTTVKQPEWNNGSQGQFGHDQGYDFGNSGSSSSSSSSSSSGSFSASFGVDINVVFGYTPAENQLYTVCNPPKAAYCLPDNNSANSSPATSQPIYSYFEAIDAVITRLSTWTPRDNSSDFPNSEKDLFQFGQAIDQATQALKAYNGTIDTQSVIKIDASLKSSAKNIVGITTNVKAAKEVFVKYNYTTLIVQVLQAGANQFSVLYPLLESHVPAASFGSLGYSLSWIICSIGDAVEYLQPHSCTPQGLEFCKKMQNSQAGSIDTKPACQVVKTPDSFSQCSQSSTNMFKYGYENQCIGKPQTEPWCSGNETKTDSDDQSSDSSSSITVFVEVDISVVFGYTPAENQLYTVCNPPKSGGHPAISSPPTNNPILGFFVEIDVIIGRLSTWIPTDSSTDFPGAEKDLFQLGQAIDQATQALKVYEGTIDVEAAVKIGASLKASAKAVVGIAAHVKVAKDILEVYGYTTLIVQVLQASANQFSVLYPLLEAHISADVFVSLGHSLGLIICSIGDAIEHLHPHSCTPHGLKFCKKLKHSQAGSIDAKLALGVVVTLDSFSQCNQSSTKMLKYGYENKCIGKPQTEPWCSGNEASSSSIDVLLEAGIGLIFGYTPADDQLYTVSNPPK
ncbi:uncharacterized protein FA14DRAFT_182568 [Meira miltonrushii]|uniref:Uncharacterized protein n=1 Tax=Meira miltonrushii TaxID=1280837 RepID=A0A316V2K2_9BASI|nr:uncharacterized protein FA14DRAFT_182568 [Meira miltonrushii]PWN31776.1 hypothetical protein FA14DRAFT_182568 [Meira miltonrushii]